jgi:hypothetical protein
VYLVLISRLFVPVLKIEAFEYVDFSKKAKPKAEAKAGDAKAGDAKAADGKSAADGKTAASADVKPSDGKAAAAAAADGKDAKAAAADSKAEAPKPESKASDGSMAKAEAKTALVEVKFEDRPGARCVIGFVDAAFEVTCPQLAPSSAADYIARVCILICGIARRHVQSF